MIDKSVRTKGTFSREDFRYDRDEDVYVWPAGKQLVQFRGSYKIPRSVTGDKDGMKRYRAAKSDCDVRPLKSRCCPNVASRKVLRSVHEGARDMAHDITRTDADVTASYTRKKVEMVRPRP